MSRSKAGIPGKSRFRQAANYIGGLIFERGLRGDLDMAVSCRRLGQTTTITVIHTDGVMNFVVTDAEIESELTPRQLAARRLREGGNGV